MRSWIREAGFFMKSDGIITVERPFVGRVIERLVCLMDVFDQAVSVRNAEDAGFILQEFCKMIREGHRAEGKQHAEFVRQAHLLHPYTLQALDWMNVHRPDLDPNWGATISHKAVMMGIVTDMHKKSLDEELKSSPQPKFAD